MKSAVKTPYRVTVRRDPEDARFWLADVEGLDGAHTSSRSLATLDRYVREVIVLAADLPDEAEGDVVLDWDYQTGDPDVDRLAEEVRRKRAEIDEATRALTAQTAALARHLVTEGGFSVREAAALLSISPARVDQMVQTPKRRRNDAA
jgi:hypothetical protein